MLLWGALSAHAAAQSCAMLHPGVPDGGRPASASAVTSVIDTVTVQLAEGGLTVIEAADADRRMTGQPFVGCNRLECGAEVARNLGVDFVVLVTVWGRRGRATSVVVALIGADDSVAGDAPVADEGVAAAAQAALQIARQRWQSARMGYLVASSVPPDATVEVDDHVVGRTPLRHLVAAGERRVRISLEGYATTEQMVVVQPSEEHTLEVRLVSSEAVTPEPVAERREEGSILNWILGGGLAAAGVGLLIPPIHGFAVDGTCVGEPPCELVHQFGTANGVLFGLGLASLGAGLVFLIAQPLRVEVSVDAESAALGMSGTF